AEVDLGVAAIGAALLRGGEDGFAVGGGDVDPAEALGAAVRDGDEAHGGVLELEGGVAGGVLAHGELGDLCPAGGHLGRVVALHLGGGDAGDALEAAVLLPALAAGRVPG